MGIKHIPDGMDFHQDPRSFPKDFGFSGSSEGYDPHPAAIPFAGSSPTEGPHTSQVTTPAYAHGGAMHPHGHHIVRTEKRTDGAVIHHHAHGGHSVLHGDGRMTHHKHDGSPAATDMAQDAAMVESGVHQHEDHLHDGEHTDMHFARGGMVPGMGMHMHKGRSRKPHMPKGEPGMGEAEPVNRPPRNPMMSTTPRNAMPGGNMPYGVQPSAEPDVAGSEQNIPQLRGGGRMRR